MAPVQHARCPGAAGRPLATTVDEDGAAPPRPSGKERVMNSPQLNGYPFDQQVVRQIRARERARELDRLARRQVLPPATGLRRFWQLISL